MSFTLILLATLVLACTVSGQTGLTFGQSRILSGSVVDSMRRFPHHVTITTKAAGAEVRSCSGTIISNKWILTSSGCLKDGDWYDIQFHKIHAKESKETFVVSVPDSNVERYPTGYDDLALIDLPIAITFTDEIKPIKLFKGDTELQSNFVVMPGFPEKDDEDILTYGMFTLVSKNTCKKTFGPLFDEYLQICTQGWNHNGQVPCNGNEGGGLISGWPQNPRLIGVFSTPLNCVKGDPAAYMNLPKFIEWIQDVTGIEATELY